MYMYLVGVTVLCDNTLRIIMDYTAVIEIGNHSVSCTCSGQIKTVCQWKEKHKVHYMQAIY